MSQEIDRYARLDRLIKMTEDLMLRLNQIQSPSQRADLEASGVYPPKRKDGTSYRSNHIVAR